MVVKLLNCSFGSIILSKFFSKISRIHQGEDQRSLAQPWCASKNMPPFPYIKLNPSEKWIKSFLSG